LTFSAVTRFDREIIFLAQLHLLIERYQQDIPWGRESLRNVAKLALELAESEPG